MVWYVYGGIQASYNNRRYENVIQWATRGASTSVSKRGLAGGLEGSRTPVRVITKTLAALWLKMSARLDAESRVCASHCPREMTVTSRTFFGNLFRHKAAAQLYVVVDLPPLQYTASSAAPARKISIILNIYLVPGNSKQYACDVVVVIWIDFCCCCSIPKKQRRVLSSSRRPAVSLWRHFPPTQQQFSVPSEHRVPCPTRRTGSVVPWPPGDGSLAPRDVGEL